MPTYSKDRLIKILREADKAYNGVTTKDVRTPDKDLPSLDTFNKYFGNFKNAKKAAGLEVTPQYTDEELIQKLKKAKEKYGEKISARNINTDPEMPTAATYHNRFGSLAEAKQKAGIETREERKTPSEEELKQKLKEMGKGIIVKEKFQNQYPKLKHYRKKFGGVKPLAKKLGIAHKLKEDDKWWTEEEVINKFKKAADKTDGKLTIQEYRQLRKEVEEKFPSISLLQQWFGSWNKAKQKANLERNKTRRKTYSNQELLQNLKNIAEEHEEVTQPLLHRLDTPTPGTYKRRFGSWEKAKEKAGINQQTKPNEYTDEELIQTIHNLKKRKGTTSLTALRKDDKSPSATAFYNHFGSWKKAKEKAGVNDD